MYLLDACYEKLEVLGDAILDYLINSNIFKYTIFERYNIEERKNQTDVCSDDFKPFDAHQAKALLAKNEFLARMITLYGL